MYNTTRQLLQNLCEFHLKVFLSANQCHKSNYRITTGVRRIFSIFGPRKGGRCIAERGLGTRTNDFFLEKQKQNCCKKHLIFQLRKKVKIIYSQRRLILLDEFYNCFDVFSFLALCLVCFFSPLCTVHVTECLVPRYRTDKRQSVEI